MATSTCTPIDGAVSTSARRDAEILDDRILRGSDVAFDWEAALVAQMSVDGDWVRQWKRFRAAPRFRLIRVGSDRLRFVMIPLLVPAPSTYCNSVVSGSGSFADVEFHAYAVTGDRHLAVAALHWEDIVSRGRYTLSPEAAVLLEGRPYRLLGLEFRTDTSMTEIFRCSQVCSPFRAVADRLVGDGKRLLTEARRAGALSATGEQRCHRSLVRAEWRLAKRAMRALLAELDPVVATIRSLAAGVLAGTYNWVMDEIGSNRERRLDALAAYPLAVSVMSCRAGKRIVEVIDRRASLVSALGEHFSAPRHGVQALRGVRLGWFRQAIERVPVTARLLAQLAPDRLPRTYAEWQAFGHILDLLVRIAAVFPTMERPELHAPLARSAASFLDQCAGSGWESSCQALHRQWKICSPDCVDPAIEFVRAASEAARSCHREGRMLAALAGLSPGQLLRLGYKWREAKARLEVDPTADADELSRPVLRHLCAEPQRTIDRPEELLSNRERGACLAALRKILPRALRDLLVVSASTDQKDDCKDAR